MDSSTSSAAAAAAATAPEGRWQLSHVIKATVECVFVASLFVLSCYGVSEDPRRLRLRLQDLAVIALAYAAVVALTMLARRLDALHHGKDDKDGERWLKLAARALASLVVGGLIFRTDNLMATVLLFAFVW